MIVNMGIYEQLRSASHATLVNICRATYGDRVWFNKGKRVVVEMKYHDLLSLAFKIENEKFNNGVPFMPKPVLKQVSEKILPRDHSGNYTWMGKVDGIPFAVSARHACDVNRIVGKILGMIDVMEDDEKKGYVQEMEKAYKEITTEVAKIKAAADSLMNEKREAWLDNVAESSMKWYATCQTRAFDMAKTEHYRARIYNKYKKLLSLL